MNALINLILGKLDDKPFVMALVSQAITWGLGIAATVAGHPVGSPTWTQYLPAGVAAVISAFIHRTYSGHAAASYAEQLKAGVVMPDASPVGVGSGPPLGPGATVAPIAGPETVDAPRGPIPSGSDPANAARLNQPPQP